MIVNILLPDCTKPSFELVMTEHPLGLLTILHELRKVVITYTKDKIAAQFQGVKEWLPISWICVQETSLLLESIHQWPP